MSVLSLDGGRSGWGFENGRPGRFGVFFIGIWTLFLLQPLSTAWEHRDTVAGWVGIVSTLLFGAHYLRIFATRRQGIRSGNVDEPLGRGVLAIAGSVALALVMMTSIGQDGTASGVYVCVLCAMTLPNPWAVPSAVLNAAAYYAAGLLVPGWHHDGSLLLSMLAATLAVWGIQQMLVRNSQLLVADEENRRLAVSDERNRFARDLHDILGHSLTVITVKAELAQKLIEVDPERARVEVADLERLSRDALADVRRAVEGYRELTLPGELTRARNALHAAQIEADLPNSTDEVPSDLRELFAWTVREGVTNVIRHSGATRCVVRLHHDRVEVSDDGCGPVPGRSTGSGLTGLRERASAHGATVVSQSGRPSGFCLEVLVP